jgi:hypothetical protein
MAKDEMTKKEFDRQIEMVEDELEKQLGYRLRLDTSTVVQRLVLTGAVHASNGAVIGVETNLDTGNILLSYLSKRGSEKNEECLPEHVAMNVLKFFKRTR